MTATYELPIPPTVSRIKWRGKNGKPVTDDRVKAYRDDVLLSIGLGHIAITGFVKARVEFFTQRDMPIVDCRLIYDALVNCGIINSEKQVKYALTEIKPSKQETVLVTVLPMGD